MLSMKSVTKLPGNEEISTVEEHVRNSEILKNANSSKKLEFELNDKTAAAKLVKAATRIPMEIEENSTSINLIFSAGA